MKTRESYVVSEFASCLHDNDVDDEKEVILTANGGGELREGERRVVISGTTVVERDAEEDD